MAEPLAEVNVLITASMGPDLQHRLKESGILPIVTMERDPDTAVAAFLSNNLAQLPVDAHHKCHDH
ncbi:MAG: hypothetical protein HC834_11325 [Rhodospirillales bacterium]|nr:hypothetical protein [Rhodospirillales bacterium]